MAIEPGRSAGFGGRFGESVQAEARQGERRCVSSTYGHPEAGCVLS